LRMVTWGVLMLIGLQKAVINSELQNTVKSRKKKNQVRNDGLNNVRRYLCGHRCVALWQMISLNTATLMPNSQQCGCYYTDKARFPSSTQGEVGRLVNALTLTRELRNIHLPVIKRSWHLQNFLIGENIFLRYFNKSLCELCRYNGGSHWAFIPLAHLK
ncbi:hypothetical protein, partial [Symbiopectobacterium sp.]|uniref:hypothetical protein n=1 Tax=Symbiopectobacterium sp. TaxID=2952789 RepID=UPI003F3FBA08